MFFTVPANAVPYDRYAPLAPPETTAELKFLAQELKGLRVLHVNSTAAGGGVAEILQSMVPLMKGPGHRRRPHCRRPAAGVLPGHQADSQPAPGGGGRTIP